MTNRQSNIIFYSIICLIISALLINYFLPSAFDNFTKNSQELTIKEAMKNKDFNRALASYKILVANNISRGDEQTAQTAAMHQEMANLHFLLGNKVDEKNNYLKSIDIQEQLNKVDLYLFASSYFKLATLYEDEKQYDRAQYYFEQALSTRLGNVEEPIAEDESMFIGMQKSRIKYLKLNHRDTIATYKKLGDIHRVKNEDLIAKNYYVKALAASKNTWGEEHTQTLQLIALISRL